MKIRNDFVSNSSSFVIGKNFMSPEQIEKFRDVIDNAENESVTYINEGEYYFFGQLSQNDEEVMDFLKRQGLNEYAETAC